MAGVVQENWPHSQFTVPVKQPESKDGVSDWLTRIGHKVLGGFRGPSPKRRSSSGEFLLLVVRKNRGERVSQSLCFHWIFWGLYFNFWLTRFYYTRTNQVIITCNSLTGENPLLKAVPWPPQEWAVAGVPVLTDFRNKYEGLERKCKTFQHVSKKHITS